MSGPENSPGIADIEAAAARLAGRVRRTPVLENRDLNARLGGRVLFKPEMLQVTGSFKFRGASNFLARMTPEARSCGVVAFSSGNHAQGVAAAASLHDAPAVIVMPEDAPAVKREGTAAWQAEIVSYDREHEDREAIGRRIAADRGLTLVRPFDDPWIIAGQGTLGLELAEDADSPLDAVLIPCGGGGLAAGVGLAIRDRHPDADIVIVEPAGFDDAGRSLRDGRLARNETERGSICDALLSRSLGEHTLRALQQTRAQAVSVSDDEVREAMRQVFRHLKLVVEPGGAVALAALLAGRYPLEGRTVGVVLSGGNVDPGQYAAILDGRS